MEGRNWTGLFIFLTTLVVILYDCFALWKWGRPGTISNVTREAAQAVPWLPPLIAFGCGVLYWHFFW